jgi:DNA polymerase (family 10)
LFLRGVAATGGSVSTNSEVAQIFYAIADLLEIQNERFKPEAYRRAARSIESLGEDLRHVANRGGLGEIPGVGEALRAKVAEYLRDGRIHYYEDLRQQFPPGVIRLMQIPGVGPKTTARFYRELHLESPEEVARAIDEGRLAGLPGFGERKIEKLKEALAQARGAPAGRLPLDVAWRQAREVLDELRARAPIRDFSAAGSLRRCREDVGDLDLLVTTDAPTKAVRAFVQLPGVREIVMQGDTRATVVRGPGLHLDLRVVDPDSFGAALQYFTGSKDHNIHLRSLAQKRGLKINEYGVFRGDERIGGATEEEVYRIMDLPWIPAEIRENHGEIEAAQKHQLPQLVSVEDLKGELHRHLREDDDAPAIRAIAEAARRRKFDYVGLVLPEPKDEGRRASLLRDVRDVQKSIGQRGPRLFVAEERALGRRAPGPERPEGVDYLIGVAAERPPAGDAKASPATPLFVGHLALAEPGGVPPAEALEPWFRWCRTHGVALEITPSGAADGLDAGSARRFVSAGGSVLLSAGGDSAAGFTGLELSTGRARRAWITGGSVLNARPAGRAGPPRGARPDE